MNLLKNKDLWILPVSYIVIWAIIFLIAMWASSHDACDKKQCPEDKHPVFFKEVGCQCMPKELR